MNVCDSLSDCFYARSGSCLLLIAHLNRPFKSSLVVAWLLVRRATGQNVTALGMYGFVFDVTAGDSGRYRLPILWVVRALRSGACSKLMPVSIGRLPSLVVGCTEHLRIRSEHIEIIRTAFVSTVCACTRL